jgi:hypothetical protein
MLRALALLALTLTALHLGGCASTETSALAGAHVPADQYARTFQAARDVLREYRYSSDRVDAPQGVLTSLAKSDPGVAKVWEAKSGANAAWEDLLNYTQRTVQIAFITGEGVDTGVGRKIIPPSDPDRDLVAIPRDTTMLVRVVVERVERDGRRISADSVRVERRAVDPSRQEKGVAGDLVPQRDDAVLAADLLRAIVARSGAAPAQAAPVAPAAPASP